MPAKSITPQEVQLHSSVVESPLEVNVAGAAVDAGGSPIALTNLTATLVSGTAVSIKPDADPTDDNDTLLTGPTNGDTAQVKFDADGADGKKYEAIANITLIAPEITLEPMTLTFVEKAA